MNIKQLIFSIYFIAITILPTQAQETIEARLEFTQKVPFEFTDEWQYLTTDIYLFNGETFTKVINELGDKRRRRRRDDEYFEYLLITAKIKDVKLLGNDEIVYPIFNFHIDNSGRDYKTFVSNNLEVIRVIDKLPLTSEEDNIEAEIRTEAITNNQSGQVMQMIASQLVNISNITNPTNAVLSLVGEFGKFIECNTGRKEYKFNSTIRLYEGHNFNMRLHSVRIYSLVPSKSDDLNIPVEKLQQLLETEDNMEINRRRLNDLINFDQYPYLIIVNYKSLYKLDVITGDEITQEVIEKRKTKIEKAYRLGLIRDEPYRQEKYFIEFLQKFNEMKSSINLYKLNNEIRNTDAIPKNLFAIIQNFRRLKSTYNLRLKTFKHNPTFQRLFKSEYDAIFANAQLYLEGDANLKNSKEFVNTIFELEQQNIASLNAPEREAHLKKLYTIDLPNKEFLSSSIEGQTITKLISQLETKQYYDIYERDINKLRNTKANDVTIEQRNQLMNKIKTTNCEFCREKALTVINDFNKRYEKYLIEKQKHKRDSLLRAADEKLFLFFKKEDIVSKNLEKEESDDLLGSGKDRFLAKHKDLIAKTKRLETMIGEKPEFEKLSDLHEYMSTIENLVESIAAGYASICQIYPQLCKE